MAANGADGQGAEVLEHVGMDVDTLDCSIIISSKKSNPPSARL
jgi:hypothetical protein